MHQDVLVEEDSGADDELEDVLQSLHGPQQLLRQFLSVVNVVLQDFSQLPANTTRAQSLTNRLITKLDFYVFVQRVINLRVRQCGAEMLSNVGLQNGVKVVELSVGYEPNYKHLSENKDVFIKM